MKTIGISVVALAFALWTSGAFAQSAREVRGPPGVVPLAGEEPAPKIVIDPPVAEWLARGMVVIQYRTENLRIVQVFGPKALAVSPRIGHVHVTVDDAPWHWADASGEPIIITRLPAGPHKVLIELVNANHQTLDSGRSRIRDPMNEPQRSNKESQMPRAHGRRHDTFHCLHLVRGDRGQCGRIPQVCDADPYPLPYGDRGQCQHLLS